MEKYRFFEHTADAKFQAYGKTLEEAFSNAALAMFSIIVDTEKVRQKKEWAVKVEGNDEKALLYEFLEELLFLLDTEHMILNTVKTLKIEGNTLTASILGDVINENYEMLGEVKAVTYNDMEITKKTEKNKDIFTVQVVVDL